MRDRLTAQVHPDTLLYAIGGLAVGGVKNVAAPSGLAFPGFDRAIESKTKTGYVVGAGMEHRLNRDWRVAVEGLYVDLGSSTAPWFGNSFDNGIVVHTRFKNSAVIGMLKVNRAF
jgi:opacity protein-like surface antigen